VEPARHEQRALVVLLARHQRVVGAVTGEAFAQHEQRPAILAGDRGVGLGVAGKRLATSAELRRALQPLRRARGVIVTIGRGRYAYSVTLPLDR
jgi:hypothetical protein